VRRGWLCVAVFCSIVAIAPRAGADDATAEALFEEGRALMERGEYDGAAAKLVASYKLDAALGTLLNLALCHERTGRIATAWVEYRDGLAKATAARDDDRIRFATQRIAVIEPRLSHLTVHVRGKTDGLAITRDDVVVDAAAINVAVPVDPGVHVLRATAAGKRDWRHTVTVADHDENVDVPELEALPVVATPAAVRVDAKGWTQRNTAAVVGTVGATVLVGGLVFGSFAALRWSDARARCVQTESGLGCDPIGLGFAGDASSFATASTIFVVTSAVVIASALVIWAVAPRRAKTISLTATF
jgi:hypothetical protein